MMELPERLSVLASLTEHTEGLRPALGHSGPPVEGLAAEREAVLLPGHLVGEVGRGGGASVVPLYTPTNTR